MWDATVVWDEENTEHMAEHGLTPEEVDGVLLDSTIPTDYSRSSNRPCKFGWTVDGRHIVVFWDELNENPRFLYPVTAYEVPPPASRNRNQRKRR